MDAATRALNGFGLGARVGERARIGDAREWLRRQLDGGPPLLPAPAGVTPDSIADTLRAVRMVAQADDRERQEARRKLTSLVAAEARATLECRTKTDRPYVERLVAFWSNHLCVSATAKVPVAALAGSYEREAIRPHVLGRFEDMVLASAHHPAMLLYLDNVQSIGPNSAGARAAGRRGGERGLNENYARELLELHTLGVDGGYTQDDVLELARMLTGWTAAGLLGGQARRARLRGARDAEGPVRFAFQPLLHEPGEKVLLGERYAEAGEAEGERAIRALCRHPATARFVAMKLVTHFIADDPPARAVDTVERVFRDTGGDLRAVSSALIDLPDAWSPEARKFRTPQDWLVAVLRVFQAKEVGENTAPILRQLRQPLWSPQSPKGFGDTTREWADPDALMNRAELARTIARRIGTRDVDPRVLLDVVDAAPDDPAHRLLGDATIAPEERVALAIAGPAFQWR